jgi:hypothetical protein
MKSKDRYLIKGASSNRLQYQVRPTPWDKNLFSGVLPEVMALTSLRERLQVPPKASPPPLSPEKERERRG